MDALRALCHDFTEQSVFLEDKENSTLQNWSRYLFFMCQGKLFNIGRSKKLILAGLLAKEKTPKQQKRKMQFLLSFIN